jgi:hypothetical protein
VSCEEAAHQIVAANVGVTLYLLGREEGERDLGLSDRLRDNVLAGVLTDSALNPAVADAAATVLSGLGDTSGRGDLTPGETALLTELLERLSSRR